MALSTAGFETPPFICRFVDKIFLSAYFCQKLFFENFQFLALILIFSLSSAPDWFFGPKTIFSKLVNFWPLYSILPQFLPKNSFCQAKPSPSSSSAGWPQLALFSLNPISQGVSISLPPRGQNYIEQSLPSELYCKALPYCFTVQLCRKNITIRFIGNIGPIISFIH